MSKYVYSKLANDVVFAEWISSTDGKFPRVKRSVTITGGAGVINKRTLDTPNGSVTEISDDDANFLMSNSSFLKQEKAGYLKIEDGKKDIDKAVSDMESRDNSDQLVENDFEEEKAPSVSKVTKSKKSI